MSQSPLGRTRCTRYLSLTPKVQCVLCKYHDGAHRYTDVPKGADADDILPHEAAGFVHIDHTRGGINPKGRLWMPDPMAPVAVKRGGNGWVFVEEEAAAESMRQIYPSAFRERLLYCLARNMRSGRICRHPWRFESAAVDPSDNKRTLIAACEAAIKPLRDAIDKA